MQWGQIKAVLGYWARVHLKDRAFIIHLLCVATRPRPGQLRFSGEHMMRPPELPELPEPPEPPEPLLSLSNSLTSKVRKFNNLAKPGKLFRWEPFDVLHHSVFSISADKPRCWRLLWICIFANKNTNHYQINFHSFNSFCGHENECCSGSAEYKCFSLVTLNYTDRPYNNSILNIPAWCSKWNCSKHTTRERGWLLLLKVYLFERDLHRRKSQSCVLMFRCLDILKVVLTID